MRNLIYKGVSVLKKSKDTLLNQITTAEKTNLVACIKTVFPVVKQPGEINFIDCNVPMNDNSEFIAVGSTPSPRTVEAETMDWCDVIHAADLNIMHRGAYGQVEGPGNVFGIPFAPAGAMGTAASAATDGNSTMCGRWYRYLTTHVGSHVVSGDIFAPIPEGTTNAFNGNFFAPSQSAYMQLFIDLRSITMTWAATQHVSVIFVTGDNFSQLASGYDFNYMQNQGFVGYDYYGQRQGALYNNPANYVRDIQQIFLGKDPAGGGNNNCANLPQFWIEWGNLPNALPAQKETGVEEWANWLINFYSALRDNVITPNGNQLTGFSNWGGWEGQDTSLLIKTGSGASSQYSLNFQGKILQAFYTNNGISRSRGVTGGNFGGTFNNSTNPAVCSSFFY